MKDWICTTPCTWGNKPENSRMWKVGERIKYPTRPNKHFDDPKEVGVKMKFEDMHPDKINAEEMALMTKDQINEKFALGYEKKQLLSIKHQELVTTALRRSSHYVLGSNNL